MSWRRRAGRGGVPQENLRLRELLDLEEGPGIPLVAAEILALGSAGQSRTA